MGNENAVPNERPQPMVDYWQQRCLYADALAATLQTSNRELIEKNGALRGELDLAHQALKRTSAQVEPLQKHRDHLHDVLGKILDVAEFCEGPWEIRDYGNEIGSGKLTLSVRGADYVGRQNFNEAMVKLLNHGADPRRNVATEPARESACGAEPKTRTSVEDFVHSALDMKFARENVHTEHVKATMTDPTYGVNQSIKQDSVRDAGEFFEASKRFDEAVEKRTSWGPSKVTLAVQIDLDVPQVLEVIDVESQARLDELATALAAGVSAFKAMRS